MRVEQNWRFLNESCNWWLCSCLLSLTGLAGALGMLSTLMSLPRALKKAFKGK